MDQTEAFKATFFHECHDLIGQLERTFAALSAGTAPADAVQQAFRALHSIKGGAGMFGFSRLVAYAHIFESALERLLKQPATLDASVTQRFLTATDILADLVHAAEAGERLAEGFETTAAEFLLSLGGMALPNRAVASPVIGLPATSTYRITMAPQAGMFRRAIEPLGIIRALKELGTLEVETDTSALPDFQSVDPVAPYFTWSMRLVTEAPESVVRTVFDFAAGSCNVNISRDPSEPAELSTPAAAEDAMRGPAMDAAALSADARPTAARSSDALAARTAYFAGGERRISSIRVDLERVDRLVNLVGEIAIAQAMVLQQFDQSLIDTNPHLARVLDQLVQHTRGLQDNVMAIRAQPVRSIFSRMPRVVREVSALLGKKVTLATAGEATEIDKTIIEALSDPLLHIIRNAIDHGIETPEERIAAGKPVHGTICLSAAQHGSRIVIQVSDDGRGIDRETLRRRAIERGLIQRDDVLPDGEIDALVFHPGISTAISVSEISGRGIGMDIVLSAVQKIGGRVSISSIPGQGTVTQLTLPLTLAVLDGMVVRAGAEQYVVPLGNVRECLLVGARDISVIPGTGYTMNVRGRVIPLVSLAGTLGGVPEALGAVTQVLVAETETAHLVALAVDEIIGQQQIVVKSVRDHYADVPGIAGATILGNGHVALIVDAAEAVMLPSAATSISGFSRERETCAGAVAA